MTVQLLRCYQVVRGHDDSGMWSWRHILHRWHQQPRIWLIFPVSLKDRPACRHGALGLWDHNVCSLISCIDVQPTNKTQSHNTIMTAYHDTKALSNLWGHIPFRMCVCYGFRVNWSCLWNLLRRKLMSLMSTILMSATVLKASYFRGQYA